MFVTKKCTGKSWSHKCAPRFKLWQKRDRITHTIFWLCTYIKTIKFVQQILQILRAWHQQDHARSRSWSRWRQTDVSIVSKYLCVNLRLCVRAFRKVRGQGGSQSLQTRSSPALHSICQPTRTQLSQYTSPMQLYRAEPVSFVLPQNNNETTRRDTTRRCYYYSYRSSCWVTLPTLTYYIYIMLLANCKICPVCQNEPDRDYCEAVQSCISTHINTLYYPVNRNSWRFLRNQPFRGTKSF